MQSVASDTLLEKDIDALGIAILVGVFTNVLN